MSDGAKGGSDSLSLGRGCVRDGREGSFGDRGESSSGHDDECGVLSTTLKNDKESDRLTLRCKFK
jgi:hypothetical protein